MPECVEDLTPAMRWAAESASEHFDAAAAIQAERRRIELNEAMADLFEQADIVFASTNPDIAFGADTRAPTTFGGLEARPINHGALTIPSNTYGNPAISIPVGQSAEGLPVGLQVLAPHFQEQVLLDLALAMERERPWPWWRRPLPSDRRSRHSSDRPIARGERCSECGRRWRRQKGCPISERHSSNRRPRDRCFGGCPVA